jgi:penicillin-binding protein-related factor A (putative recombinase)
VQETDSNNFDNIEKSNEGLIIHPNPSNSNFTIALTSKTINRNQIHIYDLTGREILSSAIEAGEQEKTIPTESMASGLYHVKVSGNNRIYYLEVLVKH